MRSNSKSNKMLIFLLVLLTVLAVALILSKGRITGFAISENDFSDKDIYSALKFAEGKNALSFVIGDNTNDAVKKSLIASQIVAASELARKFGIERAYTADEKLRLEEDGKKVLLIFGTSDVNSMTAEFLKSKPLINTGEAIIAIDKTKGFKIYIAGKSQADLQMAVDILVNYETYQDKLKAQSVKITKENDQYRIEAWQ